MRARWRKVLADMWSNKVRTVLVVLSITIGVFAVGMTNNADLYIGRDQNDGYNANNPASIQLFISPFEKELAWSVEGMREVQHAEARRIEIGTVSDPENVEFDIQLFAVEDYDNITVNQFDVEAGSSDPGLRGILLERTSAEELGKQLGDELIIEMEDETQYTVMVTGIIHDLNIVPRVFSGQAYGYVTMDTLQWMGEADHFNRLDIIVAERTTDEQHIIDVTTDIRDRYLEPAGYTLDGMFFLEPEKHWANGQSESISLILRVLGYLCIFLSAGLVTNTISAILQNHVKQIGIMRSVGAMRRQIIQMYIASVLLYGALALLIAIPAGLIGGWMLSASVAGLLNFDLTRLNTTSTLLTLQIVIGLFVPSLAALVPILAGTRMTIRQAINDTESAGSKSNQMFSNLKGLSRPLLMGLRNTFRKRARLALTVTTLSLAGAIFIGVYSARNSLQNTLGLMAGYWDFDVRQTLNDGASLYEAERTALRVPGVTIAEGWGAGGGIIERADGSETEELLVYAPPSDSQTIEPILMEGRWLQDGDLRQVVVNIDLVDAEPNITLGSTIDLKLNDVVRPYEVVGIVTTQLEGPPGANPIVYMTYDAYTRVTSTQGKANVVRLRVSEAYISSPGAQDVIASQLTERLENADLSEATPDTQNQILTELAEQFDIILNFLVVMAVLLAVVGGLGQAGTMSLNVLDRTREVGVLRSIGASNGALRQIVLVEGIFIGLISWLFGTIASVPLGFLLSNAIGQAYLSINLDYRYSLVGAFVWLALMIGIAIISSLAPAIRASKISVRAALSYE